VRVYRGIHLRTKDGSIEDLPMDLENLGTHWTDGEGVALEDFASSDDFYWDQLERGGEVPVAVVLVAEVDEGYASYRDRGDVRAMAIEEWQAHLEERGLEDDMDLYYALDDGMLEELGPGWVASFEERHGVSIGDVFGEQEMYDELEREITISEGSSVLLVEARVYDMAGNHLGTIPYNQRKTSEIRFDPQTLAIEFLNESQLTDGYKFWMKGAQDARP
jgi:hypothetical protein